MGESEAAIAGLLEAAMRGEREAFALLLDTITRSHFIVPERVQNQRMSDSPTYPNDLVTILGVQAKDRVIIPIFSRSELVREWCGVELRTRRIGFEALLASTPTDWWWGLDLGSGIEKEFSPWELEMLRGGHQNFAAIIDETLQEHGSVPVSLQPFDPKDNPRLVEALNLLAATDSRIQSITVAREESQTDDECTVYSILIGLLTTEKSHESAMEAVRSAAAPALIGAEPLKVFVGNDPEAVMLGALRGIQPLFERRKAAPKGAWWRWLFADRTT